MASTVLATLKEKKAEYIIAGLGSLIALLCVVIWWAWLYPLLEQTGALVPRRALGAIIVLELIAIASLIAYLIYLHKELKQNKENLRTSEAETASFKTRNGELASQLGEVTLENRRLKETVEQHLKEKAKQDTAGLDKTAEDILQILAQTDRLFSEEDFETYIQLERVELRFHIGKLTEGGYLRAVRRRPTVGPYRYGLTLQGREYVVKNKRK